MFLEWSKKPKLYARREVAIELKEQKEVLERSSDKTRSHETGTTGSDSSKEPVNRKNPHEKGTAANGVFRFRGKSNTNGNRHKRWDMQDSRD